MRELVLILLISSITFQYKTMTTTFKSGLPIEHSVSIMESKPRDLIQEIADFVGPFEGCHDCKKDGLIYPYICPAGYPTQGYGLLVKSMSVPPITQAEALHRFKAVIPVYIGHALRLSPNLYEHPDRLVAITSFIFNLGPTAYAGSTLRKRVNAEDWEGAKTQIVRWNKGGGRVLGGLVRRRAAEAALL